MFGLDHYDVLLASGPNQIAGVEKIEALRPTIAKKEKVVVGSTPLDELKKKYDENHRKERNQIPVVLVAPSWGKSGILSKYGDGFRFAKPSDVIFQDCLLWEIQLVIHTITFVEDYINSQFSEHFH